MRLARSRLAIAAALCVYAASASALFEDDEARKSVADLKKQVERLEAQSADRRAVQELSGTLDQMRQDIARLRGQIEELAYKIDNLDKRQKDLYVDLDTRMRKLEAVEKEKEKAAQAAAAEQQAYDAVLNQFKAGNYGASIQGFQGFLQQYPQSKLAPSAQYWIGNAFYALRDYKSAVAAQQKVIETWPTDPKSADAMLNIASSQAELGDLNASRNTLRALVQKYPNAPAAEQAKQRLARAGGK